MATTVAKYQPTGLSASGIARTIRRVLASDRHRYWRSADFAQAVDPEGRRNPGTLRAMIREAMTIVTRQIGVVTIREGTANAYAWPEALEDEDDHQRGPHLDALPVPTHEERVTELLANNPRLWRMHEIEERIFPGETIEERRRHTSFNGVVAKVVRRLGWLVATDPFDGRYRVYGPPSR